MEGTLRCTLGSQAQHAHYLEDHTRFIQQSTTTHTKHFHNIQQQNNNNTKTYCESFHIDKGISYRPISLLSIIAKTLEKSLLPGYKTQHSTVTALHILNSTVVKGFNQMVPLARSITVALDMSKSFDTINIHTLIRKLLQTKIPGTILKFIANYIKGRKVYTSYRYLIIDLFICNILHTNNSTVQTIGNRKLLLYPNLVLSENYKYLMSKYKVSHLDWNLSSIHVLNKIEVPLLSVY